MNVLNCFYCGGNHMTHDCGEQHLICGTCGRRESKPLRERRPLDVGDACACGGKFVGDRTLTNITCDCGSHNVVLTGAGGYQCEDASRGMPMIEGQELACNDCGRSWWE